MIRAWHVLRSRCISILLRGRREADLREELELHLEREAERLQASGLSRDEAQHAARRLFGGVEQTREGCRDARGTAALDALARDTRHGARRLIRDWRFSLPAVLLLALAIGANTAIFSLANAVLFREQGFARPDRLVNVYQNDPAGSPLVVSSYDVYQRIAAFTDVFASTLAATVPMPVRYLDQGAVRGAMAEYATATYLETLGLRPSLGRWFDASEEWTGAPHVAVIGHHLWTREFRADPSVLGHIINIEGRPTTIVGIGPARHRGIVDIGVVTDFWLPVATLPATAVAGSHSGPTVVAPFLVKARLREGVTVAQASAAMDVLAHQLTADMPGPQVDVGEFALGPGLTVLPSAGVRVHPQADTTVTALGSVVLAVVGLVLAIACSNLATLLLVRGATRAREVSVRLALGATRRQLVATLVTESVLLSIAGGTAGCVLAWWSIGMLQRVDLPVRVDFSLDYQVLAFACALSLVTGIAFGLAPALQATRVDLVSSLRDEGLQPIASRRLTLKNGLIVVQVAISVLLLAGTSIYLQWARQAKAHQVGYAVDGVAMIETDVRFASDAGHALAAVDELRRRIAAVSGVQSVVLLRGLPMEGQTAPIVVDGGSDQTGKGVQAAMLNAGPGFFDTLQIPLLVGRAFDERDRPETPRVAVITDRMARQYFGGVNAVGQRFRLASEPDGWIEVVGVARDTGTGRFEDDVLDPMAPAYYVSSTQSGHRPTTIVARTSRDATGLLAAMQQELRGVDATIPVVAAMTMAQRLERSQSGPRAIAALLGALGVLGLSLASIGLYAVVAFAVSRRTREIGIRMALGAVGRQVVWSIARGVAGLIAVGTGIGLVLSVLVMRSLRSSTGDIGVGNISAMGYHPTIDPVALLVIAAVTAVVGVVAAYAPSRRAARLHPLVALRRQ